MKVAWLTPYGADKLWDPALRLRRWNVHQELLKMGVSSKFLWSMGSLTDDEILTFVRDCDIVVFTEQSEREYKLMKVMSHMGKLLVRDHCEYIFGFEWQKETFEAADLVVCSSERVAHGTTQFCYTRRKDIISDMWEESRLQPVRETSTGLVAVFMGTGLPLQMLLGPYGAAVKASGYELKMITNEPGVGIKWSESTWRDDFAGADIALCPQDPQQFPGKSSVKVAQALAYGYPVIAGPIQSYEEALKHGGGLTPTTLQYWSNALEEMKNPLTRYTMHKEAVLRSSFFSPESIAKQWYCSFLELLAERASI